MDIASNSENWLAWWLTDDSCMYRRPTETTAATTFLEVALPPRCPILQDLDKLPKNQFRPPTFPFDRSFSWQPTTIVSTTSPQEAL
jgi:hypothetical protein